MNCVVYYLYINLDIVKKLPGKKVRETKRGKVVRVRVCGKEADLSILEPVVVCVVQELVHGLGEVIVVLAKELLVERPVGEAHLHKLVDIGHWRLRLLRDC